MRGPCVIWHGKLGGYFRGIVVSIMGDEMTHETHEDWGVSQWLHFDELVGGGAWP